MKRLSSFLAELDDLGLRGDLIQAGLPELGSDLAMPCFVLAKEQDLPPQTVADKLAAEVEHDEIERLEAVNGYVNLWLKPRFLAEQLLTWQAEHKNLGQRPASGKLALVEYFSPNLAKPISIGHMRNLFQGRAVKNLHLARGYEVVTDNHVGDWGTIFGIWVVGLLKFGQREKLERDGLKELGKIYVLTRQALRAEEAEGGSELNDQIQAWLIKLERGDKEAWRYHEFFSRISKEEMNHVLDDLGIDFDHTFGESFYREQLPGLLQDLEQRGIAQRQDDGSLIIDLASEGIKTPMLIQKSNGATLYASTDIATIAYRQQRFRPDKVVYVVGMEQQFHFRQLFALNRIAQLTEAELIHHSYGLIEELDPAGKKQKMSSRHRAVHLEDVLDRAYETATKLTLEDLDAADVKKIAQGALIFQEFSQGKKHNILFDWDRVFSLSDMSGPYVQYATLRLKAILQKAGGADYQPNPGYDFAAERKLLLKILYFEDVLEGALDSLELNRIAMHVFELCRELNRYYEQVRVLDAEAEARASRLWLMDVTYRHLCFSLGILGVEVPSRM
ncbi:arginine--tRNA ligase [Candidatus Saccharibacteria bacterium]|nr:arginine--tRNA ligase [Candidatus Saccharibacteria bacterium]